MFYNGRSSCFSKRIHLSLIHIFGGDVTSDFYVSKPVLESVLGKVVNETNKVTKNTLWITGNHDYNAGERDAYDSAPYYEFYMKENVGELSDLDSYYEEYKGEPQLLAYRYVCLLYTSWLS